MRFVLEGDSNRYLVTCYDVGWIQVNGQPFHRSLIVMPDQLVTDWPPQSYAELEAAHFEVLAQLKPEMVLLGTGNRQQFPQPRLLQSLLAKGIGVETMDTAAACRTYNIIMLEGRRVAAALCMIMA
jgi:uncharacterized protein